MAGRLWQVGIVNPFDTHTRVINCKSSVGITLCLYWWQTGDFVQRPVLDTFSMVRISPSSCSPTIGGNLRSRQRGQRWDSASQLPSSSILIFHEILGGTGNRFVVRATLHHLVSYKFLS